MQLDWPGLLKWSLQYTDGTGPSSMNPLTDEQIAFLEGAFKEFLGESPNYAKMVKEGVDHLTSEKDEEVLAALSLINEGLDNDPELARNLAKVGVVKALVECMKHESPPIRLKTCGVLGFALANNQSVQERFFEEGLLEAVCGQMEMSMKGQSRDVALERDGNDEENGNDRILADTLSVLNALVKHHELIEQDFIVKRNGLDLIKRLQDKYAKEHSTQSNRIRTKLNSMQDHINYIISLNRPYTPQKLQALC